MIIILQSIANIFNCDFDESDQESLKLTQNIDSEHQQKHDQVKFSVIDSEEGQYPRLGRLSKLKKQSKKHKKQRKIAQDKTNKLKIFGDMIEESPKPRKLMKTLKQRKSKSKKRQKQINETNNIDQQHVKQINSFQNQPQMKRLRKSNKSNKKPDPEQILGETIQNQLSLQKQQNRNSQLNTIISKTKKNQKKSKNIPTNQQIMKNFRQRQNNGVVESEGDEKQNNSYDNGLEMLYCSKTKRKNAIKVDNRMFGDIQFDLANQDAEIRPSELFQLEVKPKSLLPQNRFCFLSKAENIKKRRGLEANVNAEQYERDRQEKAKRSIAKFVNSLVNQEYQEEINLQIKVPEIARGKSADIINNTVFLKSYTNKTESTPEEKHEKIQQTQCGHSSKKQVQSRHQFFKKIQEETRLNRSKYISENQLKNSFKKTNLEGLQQARKRILQKKKKQLSESDDQEISESGQNQSLQEMIEKEQRICERKDQEDQSEDLNSDSYQQVKIEINIHEIQCNENKVPNPEKQQNGGNMTIVSNELDILNEGFIQESFDKLQNEPIQQQIQSDIQQMKIHNKNANINQHALCQQSNKYNIQNKQSQAPPLGQKILPEPQQPKIIEQQQQQFKHFRKLRKMAKVIAQKRKLREMGRQYAAEYIQNEAEEGSDNEEHDDKIKQINDQDQQREYEGLNLDDDLVDLIDNAVDINEDDQSLAFQKYLEDGRRRDREEIKKIIRGQFHHKHRDLDLDVNEEERQLQERMNNAMNWMKKRQQQQGQDIYTKPQSQASEDDSDIEDYQKYRRGKKSGKQAEQNEQIPKEQSEIIFENFFQNTFPSLNKMSIKAFKTINLGPLPESIKLKRTSNKNTISMFRFGNISNLSQASQFFQPASKTKTSSLVNKILNKNMKSSMKKPITSQMIKSIK